MAGAAGLARLWPGGATAGPQCSNRCSGGVAALGPSQLGDRTAGGGAAWAPRAQRQLQVHRQRPLAARLAASSRDLESASGYGDEADEAKGAGQEQDAAAADFMQGGWLWTNDAAARTQARLNAQKLRPKKSLGQNFVTDDNILLQVVRAADVRPGDRVLEVGPGTGNLTRHLIAAGARVTAVEKDYRLIDQLQAEFGQLPGFKLIHKDILAVDAAQLVRELLEVQEGGRKVKVVANLPYYITTDVLKQLLPMGDSLSNLIFMLQEEVAQRFALHQPGHRDYRYMSVFARFYSTPCYKFRISRHAYFPKPKVDGAVVDFVLTPPAERAVPPASDAKFLNMVHAAFLHRRKMMRNSMPLASQTVASALEAAGLDPSTRAQDLSLEDFVRVHTVLAEEDGATATAAQP